MTLDEIKKEVMDIHNKIKNECIINGRLKKLYKGCQIYYSDIVINPDIMFIGINPGAGYFNHNKRIVEKFEPDEKLEYLQVDYMLGKQVIKLFKLMDREILLEKAFKTNIYFFASNNINEFYDILYLLPQELREELLYKNKYWIKEIINNINPKCIICEGFLAYYELKKLFKDSFIVINENVNFKYAKMDGTNICSFRRIMSSIVKKEYVAMNIKRIIG